MNQVLSILGAAFLLLLLLLMPVAGAVFSPQHWKLYSNFYRRLLGRGFLSGLRLYARCLWASELGAVSVLYYIRNGTGVLINGSATPPTAGQGSACSIQRALVSMADSDTQALFTHNMGLDASAPTYLQPTVFVVGYGPAQAGGSFLPAFSFDLSNTNVVKMNKLNFLGTGGTFLVTVIKQ